MIGEHSRSHESLAPQSDKALGVQNSLAGTYTTSRCYTDTALARN